MVSIELDLTLFEKRSSRQSTKPVILPSKDIYSQPRRTSKFFNMIRSKLLYILLALIALLVMVICVGLILVYEKESNVTHSVDAWKDKLSAEQNLWYDDGLEELKHGLKVQINAHRAKNVILFVGDGMGLTTATATRIYKYGEEGRLSWEEFPHMGLLKVSFCC